MNIKLLQLICSAVLEAVEAAGSLGAPGGHIYAALMAHGCSLEQYQAIMGALVTAGKLRKSGELYFVA